MKNGDVQHFPTLQESIINYSENIYDSTNHINIIQHLRSKFKRKFTTLKYFSQLRSLYQIHFLGMLRQFWKHASTQKYPNLRSIAFHITSFFWFNLIMRVNIFEYQILKEQISVQNYKQ